MSSNTSKCQCFRFPSSNSISAGVRSLQKSNIQLRKNNVLLNCNNVLPKTAPQRRVYSSNENRIRSLNGFKLLEKQKAENNCNGNTNCIIDKSSADFWFINNNGNITEA